MARPHDQLANRLEGAGLDRLRPETGQRAVELRLPQQMEEEGARGRLHADVLEGREGGGARGRGRVGLGHPAEGPDQVQHRHVGNGAAEGETAPLDVRRGPSGQRMLQLEEEA